MIPYFELHQIHLGPITIQVWGTLVAIGILLGSWAAARFAEKRYGTDRELIYSGAFWLVLSGFIGARIGHVLAYEPLYYWQHPLEVFEIWLGGFSSFGGFVGATIGYTIWIRVHKLSWVKMADQFIYGLPLGLGCGRIGCFLIHDHPGTLTHFVLGVKYPDGVRHDLGLDLMIFDFLFAFVFYLLARKSRDQGFFLRLFMVVYGPVRFFLDFLRINDATYAGLTPAQYGCILLFVTGVIWMVKAKRSPQDTPALVGQK